MESVLEQVLELIELELAVAREVRAEERLLERVHRVQVDHVLNLHGEYLVPYDMMILRSRENILREILRNENINNK